MIEIDEICLEERNQYSATKWGVFYLFVFIILNGFLKQHDLSITNPQELISIGLVTAIGLVSISILVLHIVLVIWIIRISLKLNRSPFAWGFWGLISSPITLIVLGFKDYYIDNETIRNMVEETRMDYKAELLHIQSTQDLSTEEFVETESALKVDYELKLKDKVIEYLEKENKKKNTFREKLEGQIMTEFISDDDPNELTDFDMETDLNKCPACGAKINEEFNICHECGLTLN